MASPIASSLAAAGSPPAPPSVGSPRTAKSTSCDVRAAGSFTIPAATRRGWPPSVPGDAYAACEAELTVNAAFPGIDPDGPKPTADELRTFAAAVEPAALALQANLPAEDYGLHRLHHAMLSLRHTTRFPLGPGFFHGSGAGFIAATASRCYRHPIWRLKPQSRPIRASATARIADRHTRSRTGQDLAPVRGVRCV